MVYSYLAFGLCLKSEIALPELMEGNGECDVSISFGKADLMSEAKAVGPFYRANEDEIQLTIKDAGVITVRKGREIIVDPPPNIDEDLLRPSITTKALACILQQRGFLVFHASAVVIDGSVAIFMGDPGSGKSTIAAYMHYCGYSVLSDEIVAVQAERNYPIVLSGLPHIRLLPESAKYLGIDPENPQIIKSDEEKIIYSAQKGFPKDCFPLERIYVLKKGFENRLETIGPQESFIEIINNYYTVGMLTAGGGPSHLRNCSRIINEVPFKRLYRADSLNHMTELINLVKKDMSE